MTALLLISGSTRTGSTNTAALRTAAAVAPPGVRTVLWEGLADLPAFTPDGGESHPAVARLRAEVAAADAVLFCTPEYAGNLPGSLKNALDWLVGSGELYRKPAAWLNVAAPGRGDGALAALAGVLGYVAADIVDAACLRVHVPRDAVTADGDISDEITRKAISAAVLALAESTE